MTQELSYDFFAKDANNLINLGKLVILDIALNNADRFPITQIWHHSVGNPLNFIFMID